MFFFYIIELGFVETEAIGFSVSVHEAHKPILQERKQASKQASVVSALGIHERVGNCRERLTTTTPTQKNAAHHCHTTSTTFVSRTHPFLRTIHDKCRLDGLRFAIGKSGIHRRGGNFAFLVNHKHAGNFPLGGRGSIKDIGIVKLKSCDT